MIKLAIICNTLEHAQQFVIKPFELTPAECIIITPERTEKMYGYMDIRYYQLRPMYAREKQYADSHGWKEVVKAQLQHQTTKKGE